VKYNFNSNVRIARIFRKSGIIEVNPELWKKLNEFEKKFILAHEKGHFELQTSNELRADLFALNFLKTETRHLKDSLLTLLKLLNFNDSRHNERISKLLEVIELQDYFFFNNKNIIPMLKAKSIDDLLAVYLNSLGISSTSQMTDNEKITFLKNFYALPEIINLLKEYGGISQFEGDVENFDTTEKLSSNDAEKFISDTIAGRFDGDVNEFSDEETDEFGGRLKRKIKAAVKKVGDKIGDGAKAIGLDNPKMLAGIVGMVFPPAGAILGALVDNKPKNPRDNGKKTQTQIESENKTKNIGGNFLSEKTNVSETEKQIEKAVNEASSAQSTAKQALDKKKKMFIIGGAIAAVIIIVGVIFLVTRNKK